MTQEIKKILDELYAIDPAFRQHEGKLISIIGQLLQSKPEVKINQEFVEKLRRQLAAQATLMKDQTATQTAPRFWTWAFSAGALVVILALVANIYKKDNTIITQDAGNQLFASNAEVSQAGQQAFGRLSGSELAPATGMGGGGMGGDAFAPLGSSSAKSSRPQSGGGGSGVSIYPYQPYTYVYKGGEIKLTDDQLKVYRRVKGLGTSLTASQLLKQLNFGMLDANKFSNTKVESLVITEDREFGYNLSISFTEGVVGIYQNWQRWPMPEKDCRDEQCYQNLRMKLSDIPSNEELIAISNKFLSDHKISLASYGSPVVQDTWRVEYENFADKSQFYIPNMLTVVYPLKIEGQEVYDQSGNPTGLMVSVDARFKKVSGVNELTNLKYQSSMYPAVTDAQAIINIAEKGGQYGLPYPMADSGSGDKTEVGLGQPQTVYVKFWHNDGGIQSQELLAPALFFPFLNFPQGNYYQKGIVVPLVKELLEQQDGGPIRIMPAG